MKFILQWPPALTPKAECIIRKEKGNKGKAQGRTEEPDGYLGNIWRDCPSTVEAASSFLQNCLEDVASSFFFFSRELL